MWTCRPSRSHVLPKYFNSTLVNHVRQVVFAVRVFDPKFSVFWRKTILNFLPVYQPLVLVSRRTGPSLGSRLFSSALIRMPTGKVLSQDAVDMIRYMHEVHHLTYAKIGELIGRPKAYIGRVIESVDPITGIRRLQKKGRHVKTTSEHNSRIRDLALANPFIGCEALTQLYNQETELKLSKSSVHRRLKEVGVEVVKVPATTEDVQDKKTFPKSQTVWKFVQIPERKKRVRRKKEDEKPTGKGSTLSGMPAPLPVASSSDQEYPLAVHTINILIDPSLGIPQIMQFG